MRDIPLKWVWDQARAGVKGESVIICCVMVLCWRFLPFYCFLLRFVECVLPLTPIF